MALLIFLSVRLSLPLIQCVLVEIIAPICTWFHLHVAIHLNILFSVLSFAYGTVYLMRLNHVVIYWSLNVIYHHIFNVHNLVHFLISYCYIVYLAFIAEYILNKTIFAGYCTSDYWSLLRHKISDLHLS